MSQRREIEARLALYEDLSGILGAMRSFALAELRRVTRREAAQAEVVAMLGATLADLAPALPEAPRCAGDIWLLFGSTRGFCGSFNEDIVRAWRAAAAPGSPVVAVGERLAAGLDEADSCLVVPGAVGALDAAATVERILRALDDARRRVSGEAGLVVCFRDDAAARSERLLPLGGPVTRQTTSLPLTQEPAGRVARQVIEHYFFHTLLARLLHAIRVENHMRLTQMENALRHLGQGSEDMQRRRDRLRQEEIVEEIELIAQGRPGF